MARNTINNLRPFLIGGDGAPEYAPDGLLALRQLSVENLAKKVKVTRVSVYNYINEVNRPTTPVLRRLCAALDVPFEEGLRYCSPVGIGRPPNPHRHPAK